MLTSENLHVVSMEYNEDHFSNINRCRSAVQVDPQLVGKQGYLSSRKLNYETLRVETNSRQINKTQRGINS